MTNNKDFIEELAERKISLKDFFDLLNVWEGMRYAEKGIVIRKLVERSDLICSSWKYLL